MGVFSKDYVFDADAPPRQKRELRVKKPQKHLFKTDDGVELRLTNYNGGNKGPVILSHCIGISSLMFSTDTIETNFVEYLYEHGYDIWSLDFRFSPDMAASQRQSSFDDVATLDYPATVAKVRELTGSESVQVVAHGNGSVTLTMALLAGLQGVRSAVCSQVSTHLLTPLLNRIKTGLYLPSLSAAMGIKTVTTYTDSNAGWQHRLFDWFNKFYPIKAEERCNSPVCRRITSTFGPLYEHDQLSSSTHDTLHEMFGVVNITAFRQMGRIARKGHLVSVKGENSYLPHLDRLAFPIAFVHGEENDCVLPKSTETTYNLLREKNGDELYSRYLVPNYGHVDCIVGKNAVNDVYPFILKHLETTA